MRTGNVIRDPEGNMWIVSDVHDHGPEPTVEVISFDSENVSGVLRLDDHERKRSCHCESFGGDDEYEGPDPECKECKGRGEYVVQITGWKHSKVLASNVQEFIMSGVKRMMRMSV